MHTETHSIQTNVESLFTDITGLEGLGEWKL